MAPLPVKTVPRPALALSVNIITPRLPRSSAAAPKFCMIPELLVIPTPLIVSVNVGLAVMINLLAPGLKTMLLASVLAERKTPVVFEMSNVAVSAGPLGTVFGVQLAAVFQSPLVGSSCQVALPATAEPIAKRKSSRGNGKDFSFHYCSSTPAVFGK